MTKTHKNFIKTLENHKILEFDSTKEKIICGGGLMKTFLSQFYPSDILCKMGLYPPSYKTTNKFYNNPKSGITTPCMLLHPAAFEFIVGKNSIAVTIHKMKDEMRKDIAQIIGLKEKLIQDIPITLIKCNRNGEYNKLTLIHEATHIVQKKQNDQPTLIDEIDAFINEIIVYQQTTSKKFDKYILTKKKDDGNIDEYIFIMTKTLWDLTINKNFWDINKQDKINWIQYFLKNNPLKNDT